jgi:hypothetical protein
MVQVPVSSYHIILAELHTGMLVLAGLSILAIALTRLFPMVRRFTGLASILDPASYVAAICGSIIFVSSGIVGLEIGPFWPLLTIPAAQNKIMFAAFALNLWLVVIAIRSKYGVGLWSNRGLGATYALATIAAMGFLTITGCESAHITSTTSPFDPLWQLLGLNLDRTLVVFPELVSYALVAVGIALIAAALVLSFRWRRHRVN